MTSAPTEGPVIDICRGCQLVWFDASELEAMPRRSADEIAQDRRTKEGVRERRQWQRRRDDLVAFETWITRHPAILV